MVQFLSEVLNRRRGTREEQCTVVGQHFNVGRLLDVNWMSRSCYGGIVLNQEKMEMHFDPAFES